MSKKKDIVDYFRKIGYRHLYKESERSVLAIRDAVITDNSWVDTFRLERFECVNIPCNTWLTL